MVQITDEHWKEIEHYFNHLCDQTLYVCPHCGMPYEEGYRCANCGADNSEYEEEDHVTEWTLFKLFNMNDYLNKDMGYHNVMNIMDNVNCITAVDAHKMAIEACETKDIIQLKEIMNNIKKRALQGNTECCVSDLRMTVKGKLEDLGYKVDASRDQRDGNLYTINW